jgi:hypothetical protein
MWPVFIPLFFSCPFTLYWQVKKKFTGQYWFGSGIDTNNYTAPTQPNEPILPSLPTIVILLQSS